MDKSAAVAAVARRLEPRALAALTWAQFVDAMTGLPADDKAALLAAVRAGADQAVGRAVLHHVRVKVRDLAATEATARLADDALGLADLDGVL